MEEAGLVKSLAFVVMPDHFHWLIELQRGELGDLIKKIKGKIASEMNHHLAQSGVFWQKGYYDHCLRQDEEIRQVARYLVANPLRAGLVDDIMAYSHWDAVWVRG